MSNPNNLEECFIALNKMLSESELDDILTMNQLQLSSLHHSLGQWIRNNWGLWHGGGLQDYFKKLGLFHADDMSGIIITSFWRHLRNEPLEVEAQVKSYLDFWAKNK